MRKLSLLLAFSALAYGQTAIAPPATTPASAVTYAAPGSGTSTNLQTFFNGANPGYLYLGVAWGDSLTYGEEDGSLITYPSVLQSVTGRSISNQGITGQTSTQIAARQEAATSMYGYCQIIWAGRNNYSSASQVESDIAAMVADITSGCYIVMGIVNGDYPSEQSGQAGYNEIVALNSTLASTYPNNYLDIRSLLCTATIKGEQAVVSDASAPVYLASYTSGGGITTAVICSCATAGVAASCSGSNYAWLTH